MEEIKLLKKEFIGTGEVKGFHFRQVYMHDKFYVYEVTDEDDGIKRKYYELIKRYTRPEYFTGIIKEVYPKAKDFGYKGWTQPSLERISESILKHFNLNIDLTGII